MVFPHHENEIAQSESLTGKPFARYWVHGRFLMMNGRKMSKSLGNYVSFDDVLSRYSAEAFRYFYLSVHYRRPLDYTESAMESAENSAARLRNTLDLVDVALKGMDVNLDYTDAEKKLQGKVGEHVEDFEATMDDDLDTHGALDALHAMSGAINEYVTGTPNKGVLLVASESYRQLLNALGLFDRRATDTGALTEELIGVLTSVRERLRTEKNYQLSDKIRDDLGKIGVALSDTSEGTTWKLEK